MSARPPIDSETLTRLRSVVRAVHARRGRGVPVPQLVALAHDLDLEAGLTIDFDASRDLGEPMVVVRVKERASLPAAFHALTVREQEVARLLAGGLTNREIADRLCIALSTVKDHVHHILSKSGLRSRAAIISALQGTA